VVGPAGPAGKQQQPAQQKFLHALRLPPASTLSTDVLASLPEGCGGCPYQAPGQGSKKRPAEEVSREPDEGYGGLLVEVRRQERVQLLQVCFFLHKTPYGTTFHRLSAAQTLHSMVPLSLHSTCYPHAQYHALSVTFCRKKLPLQAAASLTTALNVGCLPRASPYVTCCHSTVM
jgi:hypothetical protein